MMLRALAPSGVPVKLTDILAGLSALMSGRKALARFNNEVCQFFGVRYSVAISSGRAGLSVIFRALKKLHPGRSEVLIPAFTSFSVPSAVVNAGLQVSLYDIDPTNLSPVCSTLAAAITDRTLCIVVCHLYGYPADLDAVVKLAQELKIPLVDDAAQAMGASYKGRLVGSFGDVGLFSLSRGKNITAVDGGIIVTNDKLLAEAISSISLEPVGIKAYLMVMIKAVVLSFLLHPCCYWLPSSIPALHIGASHFNPDFVVQRFTAFQAGIAQRMLDRLGQINAERRGVAARLTHLFSGNRAVEMLRPIIGAEPVYLRFPVISSVPLEFPKQGVVRSYPAAVHRIPGIKPHLATNCDFPGADLLAERILTFPTHCYVTDADCLNVVSLFPEAS